MHVRFAVRHLTPGTKVSVSDLWDTGHRYLDMAYNAATQQPAGSPLVLTWETMAIFLVGGRSSLVKYLSAEENAHVFGPFRGKALGLIAERKISLLKKDLTAVGVCNVGVKTGHEVMPLAGFVGKNGVLPLNVDGAWATAAQLGSVVRHLYFDRGRRNQEMRQVLVGQGFGF